MAQMIGGLWCVWNDVSLVSGRAWKYLKSVWKSFEEWEKAEDDRR
jgi:hypothetical protein